MSLFISKELRTENINDLKSVSLNPMRLTLTKIKYILSIQLAGKTRLDQKYIEKN
jgi:hypothetical protein